MRVLVLRHEDDALAGPWIGQPWDEVFDLGRGAWGAYERWSRDFHAPVRRMDDLCRDLPPMRRVREILEWGRGRLVDREGIDWWELIALLMHQQLEALVLLEKFVGKVPAEADVFITRDGFEARTLRLLLNGRLHVMDSKSALSRKSTTHYAHRLKRLSAAQILDILGDTYDGAYRLRRYWHRPTNGGQRPVVLLPSAYVNVSLLEIAYARLLPETAFLLVSTRRSGRLREAPANVEQAWLAGYARDSGTEELRDILAQWTCLQEQIGEVRELAILRELGVMKDFTRRVTEGMAVRNAWRQVFEREAVSAVLCADDSNPYTHLPLLLARKRGLPTIACHHGAFDGRYLMKTNRSDLILAKGRMEWDYLVNVCGVDRAQVEIGAPGIPQNDAKAANPSIPQRTGDSIVFFSEPYELASGRAEEIYRDLLPRLVELAVRCGKKVVVKLHPSESRYDRQSLAGKVLSREAMETIGWVSGRVSLELLDRTWAAIMATSTVAMDCVAHAIPCFLCEWLDLWPYGYLSQYRKFGVGFVLRTPQEIRQIPEMAAGWRPLEKIMQDCWQPISPERLRGLLGRPEKMGCEMAVEMPQTK